jgi:hypothetical protein
MTASSSSSLRTGEAHIENSVELQCPAETRDGGTGLDETEIVNTDDQVGRIIIDGKNAELSDDELHIAYSLNRNPWSFRNSRTRSRDGSTTTILAFDFPAMAERMAPEPSPAFTNDAGIVCVDYIRQMLLIHGILEAGSI